MREGVSPAADASGVAESAPPTNGSHEAPASFAPAAGPPPAERPHESSEPAPAREYHAEPRESAAAHEAAPLAHFEPAPKPDAGGPGKPYVVWSSAPSSAPSKDGGDSQGSEE
jgi:hypothetical protein